MVERLDFYQEEATKHAMFEFKNIGMPKDVYCALGIAGEGGEVAEKIKKHYRDELGLNHTGPLVLKELGDVLWYVSQLARVWGFTLSQVAQANLDKLADRRARGVIGGSGDKR